MAEAPLIYGILPTLYVDDGRIDIDAMLDALERLADKGVTRVLLTGAYGEFQSLTDEERIAITEAVAKASVADDIMSGAVSVNAARTVKLGQRLLDAGANRVMVGPPLASEVNGADIARHFEVIGESIARDLVIYNNPAFGVDIDPSVLNEIADMPAYVAIKQGTRNMPWFVRSILDLEIPSRLEVLAASDLWAVFPLASGARGVTSTNIWVFPEAMLAYVHAAANHQLERAYEIRSALRPYIDLIQHLGQPRSVKGAMELRGYRSSRSVREPYTALSAEEFKAMVNVLDHCDEELRRLGIEIG